MNTRTLASRLAGVVLMSLALACERRDPTAAPSTGEAVGISAQAAAPGAADHIRWDIVSSQPPNLLPGGIASALANDGSKITFSGSGTFVAPAGGGGTSSGVTGGGTWETRDAGNNVTGSGSYEVTGLVRWEAAPGTLPSTIGDLIGDREDARSGLAVLRIAYSDGTQGTLIVSCDLPVGTPAVIFEGLTATKGFAAFWNRLPPVAGVDANRTLFHVND